LHHTTNHFEDTGKMLSSDADHRLENYKWTKTESGWVMGTK